MNRNEFFDLLAYEPHTAQAHFHESDARFKVLIAGARFGKSLASARDNVTDVLSGGTRGWLVGPTYSLSGPELDYLRADLAAALGSGMGEKNLPPVLRLTWGAHVESLSAHLPRTLLGREIDWLILCEAAHVTRDAFERFLRARLTSRVGRLTVATSPRGHNWIHELYSRGLDQQPGWDSFRHATWENPRISAEEVESARAALPAETFDEQYGGAFTSPSGRVYREFGAAHVAKLAPPAGAIIYKAIDIGYTTPFACIWAALDHDERLLVLREHYADHLSIPEHASAIHAIDDEFMKLGCTIGPAWADPAAAGERRMLADLGVRTHAADKQVSGGIEVLRGRLLARKDGKPGLLIDAGCANLLREFEGYEWNESSRGQKVPRKHDDHALDALRYLCVALARKVDWTDRGMLW